MLKAITQGMKKLIPGRSGESNHAPQHKAGQNRQPHGGMGANKASRSSLPDSYLDTDSLFK